MLNLPQVVAHRCQGVAERRLLFVVPSEPAYRQATRPLQAVRQQRHDGIQAQQTRRGPLGREVRPLPLRLEAQMGSAFLKEPAPDSIRGRLNTPALNVCRHDVCGPVVRACREEGPRRLVVTAYQDPADRHPSTAIRSGWPTRYRRAVPLHICISCTRPSCQRTDRGSHGVAVSLRRSDRPGRRLPLRRGRPRVPGWRCGGASWSTASRRRGAIRRTAPCLQACASSTTL